MKLIIQRWCSLNWQEEYSTEEECIQHLGATPVETELEYCERKLSQFSDLGECLRYSVPVRVNELTNDHSSLSMPDTESDDLPDAPFQWQLFMTCLVGIIML